MSKKKIIFIILAALLAVAVVTLVFVKVLPKDEPIRPDTPDIEKKDTDGLGKLKMVNPLAGDPDLSKERQSLLNRNTLEQIDRLENGVPYLDEDGNCLVNEFGDLLYEKEITFDYGGVEDNLKILVNYFADEKYSDEAIQQIQRFYFQFFQSFQKEQSEDLYEKLKACFPKDGTTAEQLTSDVETVFGFTRDDGFPFVFSDKMIFEYHVPVCTVKPFESIELTEEQEQLCLYDVLHTPDDAIYERNLEAWLHKIISELSAVGYGEKELVEAQLLFFGSLFETDYRADLVDAIRECIPQEREVSVEELKASVLRKFGIELNHNTRLLSYMNGESTFAKGDNK